MQGRSGGFLPYDGVGETMDRVMVEADWHLGESEKSDPEDAYVEPSGMVETALKELGAVIVAVDLELPEPAQT
jgi:hypothetical protein